MLDPHQTLGIFRCDLLHLLPSSSSAATAFADLHLAGFYQSQWLGGCGGRHAVERSGVHHGRVSAAVREVHPLPPREDSMLCWQQRRAPSLGRCATTRSGDRLWLEAGAVDVSFVIVTANGLSLDAGTTQGTRSYGQGSG